MTLQSGRKRQVLLSTALAVLGMAILLFVLSLVQPATADTVVGYVSFNDTTLDGTNVYTSSQTATSVAYLSSNFSHVQVQSTAAVSGTGVMTVSLQFYNGPLGCATATNYYSAEEIGYYTTQANNVTTTVYINNGLTQVATQRTIEHSADGAKGRVWPIEGKCMRFRVAGSDNFTPTLTGRMVNTR